MVIDDRIGIIFTPQGRATEGQAGTADPLISLNIKLCARNYCPAL